MDTFLKNYKNPRAIFRGFSLISPKVLDRNNIYIYTHIFIYIYIYIILAMVLVKENFQSLSRPFFCIHRNTFILIIKQQVIIITQGGLNYFGIIKIDLYFISCYIKREKASWMYSNNSIISSE